MKMISNIKDALTSSFKTNYDSNLTRAETVALKNIIAVAKERIWLADSAEAMEYNNYHADLFTSELDAETIKKIKSSIKLLDSYLLDNSRK